MPFNPLTVVLTVLGGLIVAGLVAWIRRPRLVVLVPRMFSYSQITDRGQLVEISVFNRGFKTEEAIDVTLNHVLSYEMLGSNSQDVTVRNGKLHIARIGPSDEVTVLLLVEKGTFKPDDITQCLSKETKGKTVSKLEEVSPTGPQRVGLVAGLIGLPLLLYGATYGIDYLLDRSKRSAPATPASKQDAPASTADASPTVEIRRWKIGRYYMTVSPELFKSFSDGKVTATIAPVTRKGDWVSVPVRLSNTTDKVLRIDVRMMTAASANRLKSYELSTGDVVLVPGKSEERVVRVIVPSGATDPNEKLVFIDAHIRDTDGGSLSLKMDLPVN